MEKIKCGIVEDNPSLAKAVNEKLDLFDNVEVLFTAGNGEEALAMLQVYKPDVILMDINMPIKNGIETTFEVSQLYPDIKVLMLTVFDDEQNILDAIIAGASGYLLKDEKPGKLIQAIEEILEGGAPMSPSIARKSLALIKAQQDHPDIIPDFQLTKRETEILEHIAQGKNYQIIANELFVSPKTVRKHIENIYSKMQVHNKVEAVQKALKMGIIN